MEESGKLHVGVSKRDKSLVPTGIRTSGRSARSLVARILYASLVPQAFLRSLVPMVCKYIILYGKKTLESDVFNSSACLS